MEKLSIRKDNAVKAYTEANESGRKLLEDLDDFKFDYRAIDSYEMACKRNGKEPRTDWVDMTKDEIAYIKLKEIVKAINNDVEFPRFTKDERRYFPYFCLCTQEEFDDMNEADKCRVVGRGGCSAHAYYGLAFAVAHYVSSYSCTFCGSRLAFSENESAIFSGVQHKELWADFLFKVNKY